MDTRSDSGTPPEAPDGRPAAGFFAWIRGLGIVRGSDRWFAGVAGGIAARAGIDPLIVRGLFVVLALVGGSAVLLYLVCWLLLPDGSGKIHVEELIRGRAQTGVIVAAALVAALVVIPVVFSFVGPVTVFNWDIWSAIGVPEWLSATAATLTWIAIIVCAVIWVRKLLLERGRERQARGGTPGETPGSSSDHPFGYAPGPPSTYATPSGSEAYSAPTSGQPFVGATRTPDEPPAPADSQGWGFVPTSPSTADGGSGFSERADEWVSTASEQAAEWGRRAGAKAEEWAETTTRRTDEWSTRYAQRHEATRLGAAHITLTIAVALLAAGAAAALAFSAGAIAPIVPALIAGLVVLALSLIVAGIRGKRTGWVGFLAACGVVALVFTALLPGGSRFQLFGNVTSSGGEPGVAVVAGNVTVDLLNESPTGSDDLAVWLIAGNAEVLLPRDEPTIVNVRVLAGRVVERTPGETTRQIAGPFLASTITSNLPSDASSAERSGARTITVYTAAGNITVKHAHAEGAGTSSDRGSDAESAANGEFQNDTGRIAELREELDRINWQLSEPGLSSADQELLKDQQQAAQRKLAPLETGGSQ